MGAYFKTSNQKKSPGMTISPFLETSKVSSPLRNFLSSYLILFQLTTSPNTRKPIYAPIPHSILSFKQSSMN